MVDLIYTGNGDTARKYIRLSFEDREEERIGFLAELAIQLSYGSESKALLELNGAKSLGELLVGHAGRFGRW